MADFLMDRRDLEFLLYEQFDLTKQTSWPRYAEMSKETFDDVLTQNFEMCKKVLAPTNVLSDREGSSAALKCLAQERVSCSMQRWKGYDED